jgi:hypothetical protein
MGSIPIGRTISTKESTMSISYVLRTCNADFTSRWDCGFRWPASGEVVCPDFEATEECGSGLHGYLNGCGSGNSAKFGNDDQWLLVAVPSDTIIELRGEVKFPAGEVIFSSQDRLAVIAELERLNPETKYMPVVGAKRSSNLKNAHVFTGYFGTSTSRDFGTSNSGDFGTSTSGEWGTSNSGNNGKSNSGDNGTSTSGWEGSSTSGAWGTSTSGYSGTSKSGHCGVSTSRDEGTSISGNDGTSYSGEWGTSISGKNGISTSGDWGTSISGEGGTSTVGVYGEAKSGLRGNLIFVYLDECDNRKSASFFVDGDTVKADTLYRFEDGKLIEATK